MVFFEDEARLGQSTTLRRVLARRGHRPIVRKQMGRKYVHVLAAVSPGEGKSFGMVHAGTLDVGVISHFLKGLSGRLESGEHGVLIWDGAGVHVGKALVVPENLTLVGLPPYSPELNPTENLWNYYRGHFWSNRCYADVSELTLAAEAACHWASAHPEQVSSICAAPWI